jgi:hypothetical protein
MASINRRTRTNKKTHEGATAKNLTIEQQLRRSVLNCMLWENEFYEGGESIANRIADAVPRLMPERVADLAIEARQRFNIRHASLYLTTVMAKYESHKKILNKVLPEVIMRPDEISEFLAIYWRDGKIPIPRKVKKGLGEAFKKFDAYQLAKWDKKKKSVRLRDVMRLCHPKPISDEQATLWRNLVKETLPAPDTWEVALSSGEDKRTAWERLINDNKLPAMATLMNLRNMIDAGVPDRIIRNHINRINTSRLFPSRFLAAARYAPQFEPELEAAMLRGLNTQKKMQGHTVLLVDVSGSMDDPLSSKGNISRLDAACGLAIMLREICEEVDIFTFSLKLKRIAPRHGFALKDAIVNSQEHNATYLGTSVKAIYADVGKTVTTPGVFRGTIKMEGAGLSPDRLIVITDEQSHDKVPDPSSVGYMINVASYENGVGYGPWIHCDGWSDSVVRWIQALESEGLV